VCSTLPQHTLYPFLKLSNVIRMEIFSTAAFPMNIFGPLLTLPTPPPNHPAPTWLTCLQTTSCGGSWVSCLHVWVVKEYEGKSLGTAFPSS
jgi:hypothetical protein